MYVINALLNYWDTSLHFKREVSCLATPEHGVISMTSNDFAGSVDLDWDKVWGFIKSDGIKPTKVVMLHTHPKDMVDMSGIDFNMVQGWRMALGVPVKFLVVTQDYVTHYICNRDENKKMSVTFEDYVKNGDNYPDLMIAARIMYGMSKAKSLTNADVDTVEHQLIHSDLRFI